MEMQRNKSWNTIIIMDFDLAYSCNENLTIVGGGGIY